MLFSTYIQKLHDTIKKPKARGTFTEMILEMIVTDHKILYSYRNLFRSCENYYDGKSVGKGDNKRLIGDTIHRFATNVKGYLNGAKLTSYFKSLKISDESKADLVKYFKSEVPDITLDNYPEKLSQLLIDIMKEAASDRKSVSANDTISDPAVSITISENNGQNGTRTCNERTIETVKAIVIELNGLIKDLEDASLACSLSFINKPDERKEAESKLLADYSRKFHMKNNELFLYKTSVSEIAELIQQAVELSHQLSFQTSTRIVGNGQVFIVTDGMIDEYRDYLEKMMSVLCTL